MNIAMRESAMRSGETLEFPIDSITETEQRTHEGFEKQYGCKYDDIEKLIDTFFPKH